jgi:Ser/Thr protein kinase RdoA (MazF antagonist)
MTSFDSDLGGRVALMLRENLWQWRMPPESDVALINLSENATFKAESKTQTLVLRVHRQGYHTEAEIRSEHHWVEALIAEGLVQTPAPVRNRQGDTLTVLGMPLQAEPLLVSAFAFVPGKEPSPADSNLSGQFEILGELCAQLHRQAEGWVRPAGFTRKIWDVKATIGSAAIWGHWQQAIGLDAEGAALLTAAQKLIEQKMGEYGQRPRRFGLIHGDPRLANLLVDDRDLWLIDFDDCGFSWFGFDFAAAVSFFEHEAHVPDLMARWLSGYRRQRLWSVEDEAILPILVLMRRMQLLGWVASHNEVPTAQAMGAAYTEGALLMAERFLLTEKTPFS